MLHEIDERSGDGLMVTLFWSDEDNTLAVDVKDDRTGNEFRIEGVPPEDRADAFLHPFSYTKPAKAVA